MKKLFLTLIGAALVVAPALAQVPVTAEKVDVNKLRAAIERSDAEIADAKKAAKAATWLKRGTTLLDADGKPVSGLYSGMPENMLKLAFGEAPSSEETVEGKAYTVYTNEHFKAYTANGVLDFYVPTTIIDPAALDKAYDAFAKAYDLDAKSAKKVGEGMTNIRVRSFEQGGTLYSLRDYTGASANFRRAFKASSHATSPAVDTLSIYYAGMSAVFGQDYAAAIADLDKALSLGYDADGDTYRLKFLALYSLDRKEESLKVLEAGIAIYPDNENLIDMIMSYYAENEGDPSSLIPMVQDAIAKNPGNARLHLGLARVYDKLGQTDNAIAAIRKAVELTPDDFAMNYFEGLYIVKKADEMYNELGRQNITSNTQYQQALSAVFDVYRSAIAPLEKAHSAAPQEPAPVELLKSLTFRLREDEGMQAKFDKYNELFLSMGGE